MVAVVLFVMAASPTIAKKEQSNAVTVPQISQPTSKQNVMVATVVAKKDDRADRLNNYFASKGSPFSGKGSNFVEVADKYDIDWTLLPAIAFLESGLGKNIPVGSYNPYGWNNGKYRFTSWEAANETVANGLRTRYVKTGAITPAKIGPRYAANPDWASRVVKYQRDISAFN